MGNKGSPPRTNDLTRSPAVTDRQKQKTVPGCLAYEVSGMFQSVVANRRQPNPYIYIIFREGGGSWRLSTAQVVWRYLGGTAAMATLLASDVRVWGIPEEEMAFVSRGSCDQEVPRHYCPKR